MELKLKKNWETYGRLLILKKALDVVKEEKAKKQTLINKEKLIEPLLLKLLQISTHSSQIIKMNSLSSQLRSLREERGKRTEIIKKLQAKYEKTLIENKICPTCGTIFSDTGIKTLKMLEML